MLVRDTVLLLSVPPTNGECYVPASAGSGRSLTLLAPGVELGPWRRSCNQIFASLEECSQSLLGNIKIFREHGDNSGADVISGICVACLAHLALLYEVICRIDPVARGMYELCDSALQRLGMLTSELRFDEYTYLDLLLGVRLSLFYFSTVTNERGIGIGLLEEITTSLRRPDRESPLRREWDTAGLTGCR